MIYDHIMITVRISFDFQCGTLSCWKDVEVFVVGIGNRFLAVIVDYLLLYFNVILSHSLLEFYDSWCLLVYDGSMFNFQCVTVSLLKVCWVICIGIGNRFLTINIVDNFALLFLISLSLLIHYSNF